MPWMSGVSAPVSGKVKWPNVPACHGWLSLDRRGNWRLKGEVIRHAGLIAFINANYRPDADGNWIFWNGPQAVFVSLDYTPLVLRLTGPDSITAHTGATAEKILGAFIDEEGSFLLPTPAGIGLLDDRDLPRCMDECRDRLGMPATDAALLGALAGDRGVYWRNLPLQPILRAEVPVRFGFRSNAASGDISPVSADE